MSDGVWPLSFLRRKQKYSWHFYKKIFVTFRRSAVSYLDIDLGVPIFPTEIMDYFPGGGVVAFWVSWFELFHLFVEPYQNVSVVTTTTVCMLCQISFSEVLEGIKSFKMIQNLILFDTIIVSFWRYRNIILSRNPLQLYRFQALLECHN